MRIIIILFAIAFLASCNNIEKETKSIDKNLNISIDTLSITIDSTFMHNYQQTSFNKNNHKLYGYNPSLHRIDYLSFDGLGNNGFIQLQKEGVDGIDVPYDIYVKNSDEIYLITYSYIIKINSEGKIRAKNNINSASTKAVYNSHFLFPSQDSGFEYHTNDDSFYIMNVNMEYSKSKHPKKYYENYKLLSHYNFKKDTISLLNINFPKVFQEKDFGFNNLPFIHIDNNSIYYSFSPLPNLYQYNVLTKETIEHHINTENLPYYNSDYKDITTGYSMSLKSFTDNSNFGPILSTDDFIIRVYLSSTPEHKRNINDDKSYKESVLQIFDKDLQLLKNLRINSPLGFSGNFSNGKDLYLQTNPLSENEIRFLKLEVLSNDI